MAVNARFYIAEITQFASTSGWADPAPAGTVVLRAVTRGPDNAEWASSTPAGELKMTVRGSAFPWFLERLGKELSIRIDDAPQS